MSEPFLARWSRLKRRSTPHEIAPEPGLGDAEQRALRAGWAVDPAIRDFVGVAENQWDFNDATAMPGFGPLAADERTEQAVGRALAAVCRAGAAADRSPISAPPRPQPIEAEHLDPVWRSESKPRIGQAAAPVRTRRAGPELARKPGAHGGAMPEEA